MKDGSPVGDLGAGWQFWIDVGGTFTDCIARDPACGLRTLKVLSSGVVRATVVAADGERITIEPLPFRESSLVGYRVSRRGLARDEERMVVAAGSRQIVLDRPMPGALTPGAALELTAGEPAPLLAMRLLLGASLDQPLAPAEVRLGTTRGTNALLERKGARTAFVTTRGFGDVLRIANQDRPKLFALHVVKPEPLYETVVELDERIAADGTVLRPLDRDEAARALARLRQDGIEAIAICLLHAYRSNVHEEIVAREAERIGFERVAVSSRLAPAIKIVSRGDTTVVDAYLTPVIRRELETLAARLPRSRLSLMTSAGALATVASFTGRDAVLSGPAGGVVACAAAARAAEISHAIGFDMGGTSTDVSRFDGELEYEFEKVKAGVRLVAPMLAIETVAAGGGSMCAFDGQKLTVGPHSAGANPGPACYGRGGPLTITDVDLFLGRISTEDFPFRLDREAVQARLESLGREVERATGHALDPVSAALGFVRIADAAMAAAIERISIARGHDVRRYALVAFGGAAGQHACAVARELGVRQVLIHPHASVLSAWGIGQAAVRKFAVRSVDQLYGADSTATLEPVFGAMEHELRAQLEADGVDPARSSARRQLDLRYRGQNATITVAEPAAGTWTEEFERLHRQLYGHAFEGRPVEIAAARMELTVAAENLLLANLTLDAVPPPPPRHGEVNFDGRWMLVPVHRRASLAPGPEIEGPALIAEPTSTTVVPPGWRAKVLARGELLLEDFGEREAIATDEGERADPVLLEVFHNRFAAIAEQMGAVLERTSLSVNVKERLDFSCAVFTAEGDLVANAPHMPVHLGAMGESIKHVLRDIPDLEPGDVVVTNDPLRGGSHLPDVTVVTPVFDMHGHRTFFTASRAHHAEIGGIRPGSMPPDSVNLAQEGVLLRAFEVVERGRPRFDELRSVLTSARWPSRSPDENVADVRAQIAANQAGVRALDALAAQYGLATVHRYMRHIQLAAGQKVRESLVRLGDRRAVFEDRLDDGSPIRVSVVVEGDTATIDFTGSAPVLPTNLNANRAIVHAAVLYVFRCLIDEDIPLNAGVLAPLRVVVPPGVLDPPAAEDPERCPAVVGGNVETSQRVTDVLLGALGLVAASQGTMNNVCFGDERFGYYETICGGTGAGPDFDGTDAVHSHMTNTRLTDPELLEARYPVRLWRFEIRRGSGGAGRRRGGDGVVREIEFLAPLELSVLSQRRTTRPYGMEGGEPGAAGINGLLRKDGTVEDLGPVATRRVEPGDRFLIETPGGGGWGITPPGGEP